MKFILFVFLFFELFLPHLVFGKSFKQTVSDQEILKHGKEIYRNRCIGCHGVKGDGKGIAASFLDPKPRDFTSGVFKFKSTPNEALPLDKDLMRVLSMGVPGTSMPSFSLLPEISKFSVIQYLKTFSTVWKEEGNQWAAVQGAPFPREDFVSHRKFIVRAKKGRALYIENCLVCHGRLGKGDGEGGEGLTDDWDNPIVPADLTHGNLKSGPSVQDIYRILLTGLSGTPMSSFKDAVSNEELWDVSAYVLYLRGLRKGVYEGIPAPLKEITVQEAQ